MTTTKSIQLDVALLQKNLKDAKNNIYAVLNDPNAKQYRENKTKQSLVTFVGDKKQSFSVWFQKQILEEFPSDCRQSFDYTFLASSVLKCVQNAPSFYTNAKLVGDNLVPEKSFVDYSFIKPIPVDRESVFFVSPWNDLFLFDKERTIISHVEAADVIALQFTQQLLSLRQAIIPPYIRIGYSLLYVPTAMVIEQQMNATTSLTKLPATAKSFADPSILKEFQAIIIRNKNDVLSQTDIVGKDKQYSFVEKKVDGNSFQPFLEGLDEDAKPRVTVFFKRATFSVLVGNSSIIQPIIQNDVALDNPFVVLPTLSKRVREIDSLESLNNFGFSPSLSTGSLSIYFPRTKTNYAYAFPKRDSKSNELILNVESTILTSFEELEQKRKSLTSFPDGQPFDYPNIVSLPKIVIPTPVIQPEPVVSKDVFTQLETLRAENAALNDQNFDIQVQRDSARGEVVLLNETNKKLEKELNETISNQKDLLIKNDLEKTNLKAEIERLKKQHLLDVQALQVEKENLAKEINRQQTVNVDTLGLFQTEKPTLAQQVEFFKKENEIALDQVKKAKVESETYSKLIDEYKNTISDFQKSNETLRTDLLKLQESTAKTQSEVRKKQQDLEMSQSETAKLRDEIAKLKEQNLQYQQTCKSATVQLTDLITLQNTSSTKYKSLSAENSSLKKTITTLQADIKTQTDKNLQLEKQAQSVQQQQAFLDNNALQYQKQNEQLQSELKTCKNGFSQINYEFTQFKKEHEQLITNLTKDNESMKAQIESLSVEKKRMTDEILKLQQFIRKQLDVLKKNLDMLNKYRDILEKCKTAVLIES